MNGTNNGITIISSDKEQSIIGKSSGKNCNRRVEIWWQ